MSVRPTTEEQMADQIPNVFPAMRFADPGAALQWLYQAFGLTQRAAYGP
ncbi:MAG: hypothetical protein M3071_19900 [Actinomycetota bacterium]|nr:hypothetical protein [Actinomycetota bacterium]